MAENSKIEWTHHTFNPWRGCTKVSDGCKFCYADTLSQRNPKTLGVWGPKGTRPIAAESYWRMPERWDDEASQAGERRRVFCASLADVFEGPETMPKEAWGSVEAARERLFDLIESTPSLDWLLLTKRPENVIRLMTWHDNPDTPGYNWKGFPDNVWIGTSVENQEQADNRIPHLLKIPAKVRFLSCEPLLGPVDLTQVGADASLGWSAVDVLNGTTWNHAFDCQDKLPKIHWVICGGESGPNARPMSVRWARSLRDHCQAACVPFFFKQWGEWLPAQTILDGIAKRLPEHWFDEKTFSVRAGKKLAGRELDGCTWDEFPKVVQ